jgi:hypothetical protein
MKKYVGAGNKVFRRGVFGRVMTDAINARNKHHRCRTHACKHLGIVTCAAWHATDGVSVTDCNLFDQTNNVLIEDNGLETREIS